MEAVCLWGRMLARHTKTIIHKHKIRKSNYFNSLLVGSLARARACVCVCTTVHVVFVYVCVCGYECTYMVCVPACVSKVHTCDVDVCVIIC